MKEITCNHCQYTWQYNGQLQNATCPSCLNKIKITNKQPEVLP